MITPVLRHVSPHGPLRATVPGDQRYATATWGRSPCSSASIWQSITAICLPASIGRSGTRGYLPDRAAKDSGNLGMLSVGQAARRGFAGDLLPAAAAG